MKVQFRCLGRCLSSLLFLLLLTPSAASAQSDSLIRRQLEALGVNFSHNNKVTLLMSGQQKFDDMFEAIRQAIES